MSETKMYDASGRELRPIAVRKRRNKKFVVAVLGRVGWASARYLARFVGVSIPTMRGYLNELKVAGLVVSYMNGWELADAKLVPQWYENQSTLSYYHEGEIILRERETEHLEQRGLWDIVLKIEGRVSPQVSDVGEIPF